MPNQNQPLAQSQALPQSQTLPQDQSARLPDLFDDYYHDYHVRDRDGHPLFISAAITSFSIFETRTTKTAPPKIYSHETVLPNSCPHKSPTLYLEFPLNAWNDPAFDEATGRTTRLRWRSDLNVKSLTSLNLKSIADHNFKSSPARVYSGPPLAIPGQIVSPSKDLTYPKDLDPSLPIFRPADPGLIITPAALPPDVTHLFVKIPWRPKKANPEQIEITRRSALSSIVFWAAINDYYRLGVDYWIVPLAKYSPNSAEPPTTAP